MKPENGCGTRKSGKSARSLLALALFGGATAAAAYFGSRYSVKDPETRDWYDRLDKPNYTPPEYVFPIVWPALYSLMAYSAWRVWQAPPSRHRSKALKLWMTQLMSNAKWSKLFFGEHDPEAALLDVISLEALIGAYIGAAYKADPVAAYAFVPYLGWTTFAAVLNGDIVRRNSNRHRGHLVYQLINAVRSVAQQA
jgi:tryptophan-rich sensory protein